MLVISIFPNFDTLSLIKYEYFKRYLYIVVSVVMSGHIYLVLVEDVNELKNTHYPYTSLGMSCMFDKCNFTTPVTLC